MADKRNRLILVVAALLLLLVFALGSVAPTVATLVVEPVGGAVQMWDGPGSPMAGPVVGGGSGT